MSTIFISDSKPPTPSLRTETRKKNRAENSASHFHLHAKKWENVSLFTNYDSWGCDGDGDGLETTKTSLKVRFTVFVWPVTRSAIIPPLARTLHGIQIIRPLAHLAVYLSFQWQRGLLPAKRESIYFSGQKQTWWRPPSPEIPLVE